MQIHNLAEGKYFIHSQIQTGEVFSTYRIWHKHWETYLDAKISNEFDQKEEESTFEKEGQVWVELGIHPNLVAGYFLKKIEGRLWLFLEPCSGKSLAKQSFVGKNLVDVLPVALEIANGMAYLHAEGVVHGNLGTNSVLLGDDGRVRLRDIRWDYWYGLLMLTKGLRSAYYANCDARLSPQLKNQANARLAYRPPEYFLTSQDSKELEKKQHVDVYSFGILLYELFVGCPPLTCPNEELENLFFAYAKAHQNKTWQSSAAIEQHLPSQIVALVRSCLEENPARRPNFTQIIQILRDIYLHTTHKHYVFEDWQEDTLLAMSLNNRALWHIDIGQLKEAETILQEVSQLNSHIVTAPLNLNLLRLRNEQISLLEFFQRLQKYRILEPRKATVLQGRACLEYGSLIHEAFENLQQLASVEHEELTLLQADFYYRLNNYERAREIFRTFANISQCHQDLWYRLGSSSLNLKLYEETRHAWEFGLRQELPSWDLLAAFSMLLGMQGQWAKARSYLDRAISDTSNMLAYRPQSPWSQVGELRAGNCGIMGVCFSQTDDHIFCWTKDGQRRIWKWPGGNEVELEVNDTGMASRPNSMPVNIIAAEVAGGVSITLDGDETIKVWDMHTGQLLHNLTGHTAMVTAIALHAKGKMAISGSMDNTIKVWDVAHGKCITTLMGHRDSITSLAISKDASLAISGGWDNTIRIWDLLNQTCLGVFEGHLSEITTVAISPDGKQAISGDAIPTVQIWDIPHKRRVALLEGHKKKINSVYISDGGRLALSASEDGSVFVYEDISQRSCPCWTQANYLIETLPEPAPLNQRQNQIFYQEQIYKYIENKEIKKSIEYYQQIRRELDVLKCPKLLESLFLAANQEFIPGKLIKSRLVTALIATRNIVSFVKISSDSLYCITEDGLFQKWNWQTGHTDTFWQKSSLGTRGISYISLENSYVAFSGKDKMIYLWCPQSDYWAILEGACDDISSIRISPEGSFLIAGNMDGSVQIWNLKRERLIAAWKAHAQAVTDIAINSNSSKMITSSLDGYVRVWDMESKQCALQYPKRGRPVLCLNVLPKDENSAISGSLDGTLWQWNLHKGLPYDVLKSHQTAITALDTHYNGRTVLLGGEDGILKIWDLVTRQCLVTIPAHSGAITQVCLSDDTSYVFSTGNDGILKVHCVEWEWEKT